MVKTILWVYLKQKQLKICKPTHVNNEYGYQKKRTKTKIKKEPEDKIIRAIKNRIVRDIKIIFEQEVEDYY